MTPTWVEGWEHGVISASGTGIVNSLTNAPAIDSTIKRTGGYSCRFYKTVAATCYFGKTISGSPTYLVGRIYFYFTTLPAANTLLLKAMTAAGGYPRIDYVLASQRIAMSVGGVGQQLGPVLSTGQWYRVDFRMYCGGAARTIDWAIDGVDQTQVSTAVAASTFVSLNVGSEVSTTFDFYVDDIVLSTTTGDYPIGPGGVVGLSPNAGGASNLDTNIEDDGSVDVNDTTNPANIELDDVPFNGSDYIKQIGGASTLYAAVAFADTAETTIHGAQAFLAYTSAAASPANSASAKIYDEDGVETNIFTGDMSESSAFYKSVICRTPTGGWDTAAVNALQGRVGYATDYDPVPYWQGLMIQVAYAEGAGYTLACDGGSYALTGQAASPLRDAKVDATGGSYALAGQDAGAFYGRAIDADAGAYTLAGQDLALLRAALLAIEAGAYALAGQEAGVYYGRAIEADAGAYSLAGQDVGVLLGRLLDAGAGAYALTGQDAATLRGFLLALEAGAYVLTGQDVTLVYTPGGGAYIITADGGTYAVTGQVAGAFYGRKIGADSGAYALTGQDAALLRAARIGADGGSYGIAGASGGVLRRWTGTAWATVNVFVRYGG